MIDLTPLEVRKKKGDFRRGIRGYDPPQVDEFLDLVADRLEQLVRESLAMKDRVARLEQQVTDYRDREKALTEALVTAQEMREEVRSQVAREADLARRQAEQDVEKIRARASQVREQEEAMLRRLRKRQLQFVQTYRAFLEREMSDLASIADALEMNEGLSEVVDSGPTWPEGGGSDRPSKKSGGAKASPAWDEGAAGAGPDKAGGGPASGAPVGASKAGPRAGPRGGDRAAGSGPSGHPVARAAAAAAPLAAEPAPTGDVEQAADLDDDDPELWVDELLAQPALKPVRPPPLGSQPASARGTPAAGKEAPAKPAGRGSPAPDASANARPAAAELILSEEDLADGEAMGAVEADADAEMDEAAAAILEELEDLPVWSVEPMHGGGKASGPSGSAPGPAKAPGSGARTRKRELPSWMSDDEAGSEADALWDRASSPAAAPAPMPAHGPNAGAASEAGPAAGPTADVDLSSDAAPDEPAAVAASAPAIDEPEPAGSGEAAPEPGGVAAPEAAAGADAGPGNEAGEDAERATVESAAAGSADKQAASQESAQPPDSDDNLGLSLVPDTGTYEDFGDFSDLKGSADYGLLPDTESVDPGGDLSGLTLRPVEHERPRDEPDQDDGPDDDPEDLLSTVFGDGR